MTRITVDLVSDTVTKPTPAMRQAMADAEVGDEQRGEDPSVNRLCEEVAARLGKEAAVFLPSGTMCNEIALLVHCKPGDEVIADRTAHIITAEAGGPAVFAGVLVRTLDTPAGVFDAALVDGAVRERSRHAPRSRLVCVEQTSNAGGGTVWPQSTIAAVAEAARSHGLGVHMDGARLFNATVATGREARAFTEPVDSAWIDLSKGLGCPVGAVLAGSAAFVEEAWQWKQRLGGAMRQAGIIAAAGLYALEHHIDRLADDHRRARRLAEAITALPGIVPDQQSIDSNLVFFDVAGTGLTAADMQEALLAHGVRIGAMGRTRMRAVTHLDVDDADIETAIDAVTTVVRTEGHGGAISSGDFAA